MVKVLLPLHIGARSVINMNVPQSEQLRYFQSTFLFVYPGLVNSAGVRVLVCLFGKRLRLIE